MHDICETNVLKKGYKDINLLRREENRV